MSLTQDLPSAALPGPGRATPGRVAPPRPSRDSVTTIRPDGSRPYLHPAATHGRFTVARRAVALTLLVVYLALPWIRINGHPAVFLDVARLRFHLFGLTLAAQDLWLLFFVFTGVGFSLFLVTALLGRIWCGWACPQTVFLEHVYRPIERLIEGDAVARRALDAAPWSWRKVRLRALKQAVYVLLSAVFTHLFLAYFVSLPEVWAMVRQAPSEHWGAFVFMAGYTGLTYFIFSWFREQVCIVLCPYGRMQSVLTDDHTLAVGYDQRRGEPRGRGADAGDCVDCGRCVQVCPTGIDIRQGLQLECVGCTACIDACDPVMAKLGRPRGLIRYDSLVGFAGERTRWVRPRTVLYLILLVAGAAVGAWALSTVRPASFGVTRMTGAPYIVDAGGVRNQFLVRVVNKRNLPARFRIELPDAPADLRRKGLEEELEVAPLGEVVRPLILQLNAAGPSGVVHLRVELSDTAGTFRLSRAVEFLGPGNGARREEARDEAR